MERIAYDKASDAPKQEDLFQVEQDLLVFYNLNYILKGVNAEANSKNINWKLKAKKG